METLGDVIRRRSKALGLTQRALAELVGIDVRQIRRYESGEQQPVLGVAARLATTLGVSLDELAGLGGPSVDGDWWAARQVRIDEHDVTVTLPVRLSQRGSLIELEALEGGRGAWRGELRLWSGATLTGWYAGADVRSRGTMLLLLRDDLAEGRWVGVSADGAIVTGHAALARTRAAAQTALAVIAAKS